MRKEKRREATTSYDNKHHLHCPHCKVAIIIMMKFCVFFPPLRGRKEKEEREKRRRTYRSNTSEKENKQHPHYAGGTNNK